MKVSITLKTSSPHCLDVHFKLQVLSLTILLGLRATYSYVSHFYMIKALKICTHNSDVGSNPAGVTGRTVRLNCCVCVSLPSSYVSSTLNYQFLFCSILLLKTKNKKMSIDIFSPRNKFPYQTHDTSLPFLHHGSILSLPGLNEQ